LCSRRTERTCQPSKSTQCIHDLVVERLEVLLLDPVLTADLARDQLRVVDHLDLARSQIVRQLEREQHALVLGDVVGGLAQV
jgi:hypothetical protein